MNESPTARGRSEEAALLAATLVAGGMIAQQVASKTVRDALFLGTFPVDRLPEIVLASAALSIVLIVPMTRLLVRIGPIRLVQVACFSSALLLVLEWLLCLASPRAGTLLLYLHVAALGPAIVSGFWSLITERFDPRTARRRMSRLVAGSTLGGLLGGLLAERVGSSFGAVSILPFLALIHLLCGIGVSRSLVKRGGEAPVRAGGGGSVRDDGSAADRGNGSGSDRNDGSVADRDNGAAADRTGIRKGVGDLLRPGYLRHLATLVLLGALAAGLIDYALKLRASEAYAGHEDQLVRFFAIFYSAAALLALLVQTTVTPWMMERQGPSRTAGMLPATVGVGSLAALFVPALPVAALVRGAESVFRNSLYRSGYELLYAPVDPSEKRRSKAWIDIGCDRLGDGLGAIAVKGLNLLPGQLPVVGFFGLAVIASLVSLRAIKRLSRGYVRTLQKSLLQRAEALDLTRSSENLSRSTLLQTFAAFDRRELLAQIQQRASQQSKPSSTPPVVEVPNQGAPGREPFRRSESFESTRGSRPESLENARASRRESHEAARATGSENLEVARGDRSEGFKSEHPLGSENLETVRAIRSGNLQIVRGALSANSLDPSLAADLIPLLAWDEVSDDVIRALRLIAPRILNVLIEALLDPSREFAVRRRIPRVIAAVGNGRAVEGLRGGLADKRFEVRFQCGRALAIIHRRHPEIGVDRPAILAAILRELEVDRPIWESRRLLDQRFEDADDSDISVADRLLRDRSNKSLEHVFTLLSLVLPAQPLRVAFRGLHTDDPVLRGTALEYLESVLPAEVRDKLWPFLEIDRIRNAPSPRSAQEVLDQLMRSHESISFHLKQQDSGDQRK